MNINRNLQPSRPAARAAISLLLTALLTLPPGIAGATPEQRQPLVQAFVAEMADKHGLDAQELLHLLSSARFRQSIIEAMKRPAEAKPWYRYRPIFVTAARAGAGARFWKENAQLLQTVERQYGVPAEIIVAILGVETRYGGYTGKYRVLDSLSTLAFGYPKRARFFRGELEQFLLLNREDGIEPTEAKGSYAGAMGMPQFMPSSYRAYAVDFDGDGRRDLWNSTADAIASVANYFRRHGWRPQQPIAMRATAKAGDYDKLVRVGMKPSLPVETLRAEGIEVDRNLSPRTLASLVELETRDGHEYWVGLHNFYVITRYNHSNLYAMAVYQLSREILAAKRNDDEELVSR